MNVDYDSESHKFIIQGTFSELDAMRGMPLRRYDHRLQVWIAGVTKRNVHYLRSCHANFASLAEAAAVKLERREIEALPRSHGIKVWKTTPMMHQEQSLLRMGVKDGYALFMDPGIGKTKNYIDDVNISFGKGAINAAVVLCPNSVKSTWVEELEKHSLLETISFVYDPTKKEKCNQFSKWTVDPGTVKWLIMGIESLSLGGADVCLENFLVSNRCTFIVDESDTIATHNAIRSKKCHRLARLAIKRRIGTGTPISKGIHNCWSQYEFLDPRILDMGYYAFVNHFSIKGGFKDKQIVGSRNEEEFIDLIAPFTFRISKAECLDLPPKVYQIRHVTPTPEMRKFYDQLKQTGAVTVGGNTLLSYNNVLVRDLRLQQITGGFYTQDVQDVFVVDQEDPVYVNGNRSVGITGANPKLEDMLAYLEQIRDEDKVIIWCRFLPEVHLIADVLRAKYGFDSTVTFTGDDHADQRTISRNNFQRNDGCRFLVGTISAGGIGITLTAASYEFYFSNSWALRHRIQSEDRAHRSGQTKSVTIVDFVMDEPWVDSRILKALKDGKSYTDVIMQEVREATQ